MSSLKISAARNCLIGFENIVKISDFGMSREEEEYIGESHSSKPLEESSTHMASVFFKSRKSLSFML